MASNLLSTLLSQIQQGANGIGSTLGGLLNPQPSQPSIWKQPTHETIQVNDQGTTHYFPPTSAAPQPTLTPSQPAMPTPMPSPMLSQPQVQQQPSNFRFAYENMPRDQNWAQNGPRPGFQPSQPPQNIGDIIRQVFPNEATKAATIASTENAQFDPNRADNINPNDQSRDRGIFQVNSNTFNSLMQRRGKEMKALGVNSFDDMRDPRKNAEVAKLILGEGGPGRWFGWQDTGYNLNNNLYSKDDRGQYEAAKLKKNKK